jgi:hypothetical protein
MYLLLKKSGLIISLSDASYFTREFVSLHGDGGSISTVAVVKSQKKEQQLAVVPVYSGPFFRKFHAGLLHRIALG